MADKGRRNTGYWAPFNVWWRAHLLKTGERPKAEDLKRWHQEDARTAFPHEPPTYTMIRNHAKGLRDIASVKEYFRDYRARKRRAVADLAGSSHPRRAVADAQDEEDEGEEEASGSACSWASGRDSDYGSDEEGSGGSKRKRQARARQGSSRQKGQQRQKGTRTQHEESQQSPQQSQEQARQGQQADAARQGQQQQQQQQHPHQEQQQQQQPEELAITVRPSLPLQHSAAHQQHQQQRQLSAAAGATGRRGLVTRSRAAPSGSLTEPPCTPPAGTHPSTALVGAAAACSSSCSLLAALPREEVQTQRQAVHAQQPDPATAMPYDIARTATQEGGRAARPAQRPPLGCSASQPVTPPFASSIAGVDGAAGGAGGGGAAPHEELYTGLHGGGGGGGGPAAGPTGLGDEGGGRAQPWTPFAIAARGDALPWEARGCAHSGAEGGGSGAASHAAALHCTSAAAMSYDASLAAACGGERAPDASLDAAGRLQQYQPSVASRSAPPDADAAAAGAHGGGDAWLRHPQHRQQHLLPSVGSRHGSSGPLLLPWGAEGALLAEGDAAHQPRAAPSPFAAGPLAWDGGRRPSLPDAFSPRHLMLGGGALGGPPPVTTGFGQGRAPAAPPGSSPGGGRTPQPRRAGAGSPPGRKMGRGPEQSIEWKQETAQGKGKEGGAAVRLGCVGPDCIG
ncbi:hypothetical protein TSOC_004948 [Tetrabaena socialis]|uniref:Uncharacterized protein n=1 Tax=Tetrabaena socialis TaxID=47790 RepID=A0A2J8A7Q0_9CHLO|nr:hypothetical protein TSOC_004948 [Tetrabaena socialis]|eukprot:PNH08493.1 hypothetical protein TSOC_004948 [Tetrabaena socialis]